MTKADFISIIKKIIENDYNFIISTNVAVGEGINGVSYTSFVGLKFWDEGGNISKTLNCRQTRVAGFVGDCVILEDYKMWYNPHYNIYSSNKCKMFFIPLEHIVSIEIWENDKKVEETYRDKGLTKLAINHYLKED